MWAAMFSVAGSFYEELDQFETQQEAFDAIDAEALNWSCRTHGFTKEVENNEVDDTTLNDDDFAREDV